MRHRHLTIKVEALCGSDIPGDVIPEMVRLANKLACCTESNLNDVKVIAYPGDDPLHLAVAFRRALVNKPPHGMALARDGQELMERP